MPREKVGLVRTDLFTGIILEWIEIGKAYFEITSVYVQRTVHKISASRNGQNGSIQNNSVKNLHIAFRNLVNRIKKLHSVPTF